MIEENKFVYDNMTIILGHDESNESLYMFTIDFGFDDPDSDVEISDCPVPFTMILETAAKAIRCDLSNKFRRLLSLIIKLHHDNENSLVNIYYTEVNNKIICGRYLIENQEEIKWDYSIPVPSDFLGIGNFRGRKIKIIESEALRSVNNGIHYISTTIQWKNKPSFNDKLTTLWLMTERAASHDSNKDFVINYYTPVKLEDVNDRTMKVVWMMESINVSCIINEDDDEKVCCASFAVKSTLFNLNDNMAVLSYCIRPVQVATDGDKILPSVLTMDSWDSFIESHDKIMIKVYESLLNEFSLSSNFSSFGVYMLYGDDESPRRNYRQLIDVESIGIEHSVDSDHSITAKLRLPNPIILLDPYKSKKYKKVVNVLNAIKDKVHISDDKICLIVSNFVIMNFGTSAFISSYDIKQSRNTKTIVPVKEYKEFPKITLHKLFFPTALIGSAIMTVWFKKGETAESMLESTIGCINLTLIAAICVMTAVLLFEVILRLF